MHIEFAGVVSEFFKFQELKLNAKRRILHFKCPGDFLVRDKLMDYPIEPVFVSFRIGCFKLLTAVFFIFKFQHFRSHPLLNNFGLYIRFKK